MSKTAIITGASSGIGLAAANRFIKMGYTVHNWDYKPSPESEANGSIYHKVDVRVPAVLEWAALEVAKTTDSIDVLVCNAGIHRRNTLENITEEEWDAVQNTNVKGTVFTVKHCLGLLKASAKARIVIVGSDQCFIAKGESLAYGASKGALRQLTKYMALELAAHDICVNTVCPATIDTPLARTAFTDFANSEYGGDMEKALEWEASHYPLKRIGTPEDVAEAIHYLGTFENRFTTGELFKIDGGLTLGTVI